MRSLSRRNFVAGVTILAASLPGQLTPARATPNAQTPPKDSFRGGLISPALRKPKFTLIDTSGAPFDLWNKTQGYVTLLFFGYTHCPDMCPLQMSTISKALKGVSPETASEFKVVFVTTDPERDTPKVLRSWLDHFDTRFIGLTGTQAQIDAAQVAANLNPAKKSTVRSDGGYEVGHAAYVFAYSKDNLAHVIYPVGVTEPDWQHDLNLLPKAAWPNP